MYQVAIKSIACQNPQTNIANDDERFSALTDLPKHWFRFWGVENRGFFDKESGENELSAACQASLRAINGAGLGLEDVDMVIATSSKPSVTTTSTTTRQRVGGETLCLGQRREPPKIGDFAVAHTSATPRCRPGCARVAVA